MRYLLLLITAFSIYSTTAFAQLKKADIKDLAFITGTWVQKSESGKMEEFWGKPIGDNMVCSFRYVKNGKVALYEFVVIEQTDSIPVMKIRHFNRGSIAWEEKDKPFLLPLVSLTTNEAGFVSVDGSVRLTYKRLAPDKMDAILEEKDKKGNTQKEVFSYTLLKQP